MRALRGTLAIFVAGFIGAAVRIYYAFDNATAGNAVDSQVYRRIARHLVNGHGYAIRTYETHQLVPTAAHPPAFRSSWPASTSSASRRSSSSGCPSRSWPRWAS